MSSVPSQLSGTRVAAAMGSVEWARRVNRLVREQMQASPGQRPTGEQTDVLMPVLPGGAASGAGESVRFSGAAAERMVRLGLKAQLLGELALASGLDAGHVYEFAGIDRTTVSRRAARDDVLPQDVAVKALQFADLVATATDVFGSVADASLWLTRAHPVLDSETPLRRARTPWGLERVRSMLGALKYGAPV